MFVSLSLKQTLRQLEERLLDPATREDSSEAEKLLSPDFIEIGKSGRTYNKSQALQSMASVSLGAVPKLEHFEARELAPSLVLVTYRCGLSKRSSIWREQASHWQLVFHQGTPCT